MRLPCVLHKRGRHRNRLCPGLRQIAKQFWKPQIITDRMAQLHTTSECHLNRSAGQDMRAFPIQFLFRNLYIEEVNFIIVALNYTRGIDNIAAV